MAENSKIEWTDHTFNPWMGCTKVSPACKNCYAERDMDKRYNKVAWGPSGTRVKTAESNWLQPKKWNREAFHNGTRYRVFCASLADVFEDWNGPILDHKQRELSTCDNHCGSGVWDSAFCPECGQEGRGLDMDDLRVSLFQLIDSTEYLDWLILTKRPENVAKMWPTRYVPHPMPISNRGHMETMRCVRRDNVWLGTSIENQEWADKRLPHLHAAKRAGMTNTTFVSAEPLVGPIMLQGESDGKTYNHLGDGGIDWVITGGESGPDARPCDPVWFRSLRDQCEEAGTPFHFKQWGEFDAEKNRVGKKNAGRLLDGRTHDGLPLVAVGV